LQTLSRGPGHSSIAQQMVPEASLRANLSRVRKIICRVCGASNVNEIGEVEYYSGFPWKVFDCRACLCRFSSHDESIYNWLHTHSASIYGIYRALAEKSKRLFDQGDLVGLRRELSCSSKYKFVIEEVEQQSRDIRLLEAGCSRGYLTSYFILAGYKITGADVSPDAIAGAKEAFGDRFVMADSAAVEEGAPYDVIYHVGTIGCVSDPLGFTRDLLRLLTPGGQLLFNAPNADSCWFKGQLWIDAAPPPDVVTLFTQGFWRKHFSGAADVTEEVEMCPPDQAFEIGLRNFFGRRWGRPTPLQLDASVNDYQRGRVENDNGTTSLWHLFERGGLKIGRAIHLSHLAPKQPTPFGLFVKMTKK
jgi:SAM-dependent methyltransferase